MSGSFCMFALPVHRSFCAVWSAVLSCLSAPLSSVGIVVHPCLTTSKRAAVLFIIFFNKHTPVSIGYEPVLVIFYIDMSQRGGKSGFGKDTCIREEGEMGEEKKER